MTGPERVAGRPPATEELVAGPDRSAPSSRFASFRRRPGVAITIDFVRQLMVKVIVEPVRNGRPRNVGWPLGLAPVVALAAVVGALAVGLALFSPLLRHRLPMIMIGGLEAAVPRPTVSLLLVILALLLALLQTAALHAPWWFRLFGTGLTAGVLSYWSLAGIGLADDLFASRLVVAAAVLVSLVVLAALRARRRFAWWEFPTVLIIVAAGLAVGALLSGAGGTSVALGYDLLPTMTAGTLRTLAVLAVPVLIAAGLSVAEVTVSAAVWAGRLGARVTRHRWGYLILAVAAGLRLVQIGRQLVNWDPVADGLPVIITSLVVAALLLVAALVIIAIAHSADASPEQLPEVANRLALPIGIGLTALLVPLLLVVAVVGVVSLINPVPWLVALQNTIAAGSVFAAVRVLLGAVLAGLAVRHARRGALSSALVLATTAVMLFAVAARLLTGGLLPTGLDPDVLNLVGGFSAIGVGTVLLLRRRLSAAQAVTLAAALVLSALFSVRDFVSDPVGALFGVSGVALVLFGVIWDLLTGSEWANRSGHRMPTSSRVLLIMTKTLLGLLIVAFAALSRNPDAAVDPDAFSSLGDLVLGTALVAAAFVLIIRSVIRRPGRRELTGAGPTG